MKEIVLTQEQVALVDDDMYENLNKFKWFAQKNRKIFYAGRSIRINSYKIIRIQMHHMIIGKPPKGFELDHKDGNGLHNFKANLRFVTRRQNQQNRKHQNSCSQYPGVSWYGPTQKWRALISINGKRKHLGYFKTEIEAFNAYQKAVETIGETVIGYH